MKVWTVLSIEGFIKGVYLDKELAYKEAISTDDVEEWHPMITPDVSVMIKILAKELK